MHKRQLVLEDGTVFTGMGFGSMSDSSGDVIFHTSMTGYQEILSDPNYHGNIVVMTYPAIGSYGINRDDFEAITPFVKGMIVKEVVNEPSNFRSEESLDAYMRQHGIPGISGIDTRMLARMLREKGTLTGRIVPYENGKVVSVETVIKEPTHLVKEASISKPYIIPGDGKRIVVIDLGMKHRILHELMARNCHVTVVPFNYRLAEILAMKPDGVLISNGPGNPAVLKETIETVQALLGKVTVFGIGLGHQLLAIASGAKTAKLHVGNYGTNYPVKDLATDQTWLTTQSRHYYVEESSIKQTKLQITHRSLNDQTIEGLRHAEYPAFSVQFNPEGAPGSNETNFLFDQFIKMMEEQTLKNGADRHA